MNLTFREYTCAAFESPGVMGRRVLRRLGDAVRAATRARAELQARSGAKGGVHFVDVYYKDLVANPRSCVRRLYADLQLEWNEAIGDAIEAHVADRRRPSNTRGRHHYKLAHFGLSGGQVCGSPLRLLSNPNALMIKYLCKQGQGQGPSWLPSG